jgi:hypothetical protein
MKKLFTLLVSLLITCYVFAQSPQKMSYQAVIRNANNALVTSQAVGMRISILQGTVTGAAVYVESQTPTTNANGLITIEIGGGTPVTGTFTEIDWSTGVYFIKTETDPTGGNSYTITGVTQILSVPYAFYAKTAEIIKSTGISQLKGLALPYTFGPDNNYIGSEGAFIGFGHYSVSEDFIGYKNNRFYFKDSPGGNDTIDPDIIVGGKIGIGVEEPKQKLEVNGNVTSDEFLYNTPKTEYLYIAGGSGSYGHSWRDYHAVGYNNSVNDGELGNIYENNPLIYNVVVPYGAIITGMSAYLVTLEGTTYIELHAHIGQDGGVCATITDEYTESNSYWHWTPEVSLGTYATTGLSLYCYNLSLNNNSIGQIKIKYVLLNP